MIDGYINKIIYIAPINPKQTVGASVAKKMSFQRSSEEIEGESRPPYSPGPAVEKLLSPIFLTFLLESPHIVQTCNVQLTDFKTK